MLIDFWATWCGPCKKELPKLQELYDAHKSRGFVVLAITVDEDTDAAKRFASARKMTMPVLSDASGAVAGKYDLPKMPTSFLLDKKGVVRVVHEGYRSGDARKLEEKIRKLLSE